MKIRWPITRLVSCLCLATAVLVPLSAQTAQRSLVDWITAQGDCSFYFTDPSWSAAVFWDYLGLNDSSGQQVVTGTVTEKPLKDGTAEITVNIHARNAFVFAWNYETDDLLFMNWQPGEEIPLWASGAGSFKLTYLAPQVGAPFASMCDPSLTVLSFVLSVQAKGLMPDGQVAILQTQQAVNYVVFEKILSHKPDSQSKIVEHLGAAVENIKIHPVGF